jgi:hypothetical protein
MASIKTTYINTSYYTTIYLQVASKIRVFICTMMTITEQAPNPRFLVDQASLQGSRPLH